MQTTRNASFEDWNAFRLWEKKSTRAFRLIMAAGSSFVVLDDIGDVAGIRDLV